MPVYQELILDAKDLNIDERFIKSKEYIRLFVLQLIKAVKMERWGRMQLQYLHEPRVLRGWSAVQLIKTSNVNLHVMEFDNSLHLNLFSCKNFDNQIVIDMVRQYFQPATISVQNINRGFSDF